MIWSEGAIDNIGFEKGLSYWRGFLKKGGYVANAVQTSRALTHIEICFIWIPIVLCVLIAVLTYFYKLDSIRGEMTEELEKRR